MDRVDGLQQDFEGSCVHVLQIGLGTNSTFLQDDSRWFSWLSGATTRGPGEVLKGIGVDPVREWITALAKRCDGVRVQVSLVVGAVGETCGTRILFALPHKIRRRLHLQMEEDGVGEDAWDVVDQALDYLENMSRIDAPHPDFQFDVNQILEQFPSTKIPFSLLEERQVPCITFKDVFKMNKAGGCQVLMCDAEGADCEILRSMVKDCAQPGGPAWPRVVLFETRGIADTTADQRVEERTVILLQEVGYVLVFVGGDSCLLHGPSMVRSIDFAVWADKYFRLSCDICSWSAWPSSRNFEIQTGKGFSQWTWGKWSCTWCTNDA